MATCSSASSLESLPFLVRNQNWWRTMVDFDGNRVIPSDFLFLVNLRHWPWIEDAELFWEGDLVENLLTQWNDGRFFLLLGIATVRYRLGLPAVCHTTRRNLLLSPFKFNRFKHKEGEKKRKRTKKSKKRGEIDDGQGVVSAVQLKIGVIRTGIILMEDMSFSGGSSNITRGSSSSSRGESGSNPSSLLPRARFNIRYDIPLRNLWYWVLERRDNEERARRNKSIVFSSFFYCLF